MVGRFLALPLLVLASAGGALAAPFQADPQSFASFANSMTWSGAIKPYFRNLADCTANGAGGYGCRRGEVLRTEVGKTGRSFCNLDNVWYDPTSRTVQYNVGTCQYKTDQQRLQEQGQQLLQKGLNLLENQGGR